MGADKVGKPWLVWLAAQGFSIGAYFDVYQIVVNTSSEQHNLRHILHIKEIQDNQTFLSIRYIESGYRYMPANAKTAACGKRTNSERKERWSQR